MPIKIPERINKPKEGQSFFFPNGNNLVKDKFDGYNLRYLSGTKPTPRSQPFVFRS